MLSAVARDQRSYPAMPRVRQPVHQRLIPFGPLVLEGALRPCVPPRRRGTELSHDVLNPAHVPLSSANSRTLGTGFSPRMR